VPSSIGAGAPGKGILSFGIEMHSDFEDTARETRGEAFIGGSKSGFGGLGLRGTGRFNTDAAVQSLGDDGTPGTNALKPRGAFLGGSKSGTLDMDRILEPGP
jgi:hypothetical protein